MCLPMEVTMKLYEVFNGYMGNSPVSVLVTAKNEERAKELAKIAFQKEVVNPSFKTKVHRTHGPSYWNDLEAVIVFKDCSEENFGGVVD